MNAFEKLVDTLRAHGSTVKENGQDKAEAQCPAHNDTQPSLSVGVRNDGKGALLYCQAGCDYTEVLSALGLSTSDLFDDPGMRAAYNGNNVYTYPDGRKVHRGAGKKFRQSGNRKGNSLFHADRIGNAQTVYVPEGEKDVLAIESVGGVAVCSAMGAGKAHLADWTPLAKLNVIVVADDDAPGFRHARQIAELLDGVAASVCIVKAAAGNDPADHIAAGKTLGEFIPVKDESPELDDAHIGPYIAERYLTGEYLFSGAFGWMHYDGRRWENTDDAAVLEVIRCGVIDLHAREARAGASTDRLKAISGLFSSHRMAAIARVARGYLRRAGAEFDAYLDLLNVRNGVVDLRDGTLRPHDPDLLFTKVAPTDYTPGAAHPDWAKALTAVNADEAVFLQDRLGQGLTGYPPDDDRLIVLKGGGENGKSTIVDGVRGALGDEYAIPLPDRVLTARPGDHPTELMELRGARLALAEEFPELAHLNVKRLKDLLGTQWLTARLCGKDTVRWKATHTPIVTTNYTPRVDESDHGTWRRLMMLAFPHRYRKAGEPMETPFDRLGDEGLRDRVRRGEDGQHETALAWLVAGSVRWYQNGRTLPKPPGSVLATTAAWRRTADLILRFLNDQLMPDPTSHVMSTELYEDFVEWLKGHGHAVWADQNFTARLEQHSSAIAKGMKKKIVRQSGPLTLSRRVTFRTPQTPPKQYHAWLGVRFRTVNDDPKNDPNQGVW